MKYDPVELIKINLTQSDIDKKRKHFIDAVNYGRTSKIIFLIDAIWLPFIIDIFLVGKIEIESDMPFYKVQITY